MLETSVTLVGNLVDNPEYRRTSNGSSVCNFRMASTPRRFDRRENRWRDGATLFLSVSCWRQLAENVAASLSQGDRAMVLGRLRQRTFTTSKGDRREVYEVEADAVGAELSRYAAHSERANRRALEQPISLSAPADDDPDDEILDDDDLDGDAPEEVHLDEDEDQDEDDQGDIDGPVDDLLPAARMARTAVSHRPAPAAGAVGVGAMTGPAAEPSMAAG